MRYGLLVICILLFVPGVSAQQNYKPIRGHTIGESAASFLEKIGLGTNYPERCAQSAGDKKAAKRQSVDLDLCRQLAASTINRLAVNLDSPATHAFRDTSDYGLLLADKVVGLHLFIGRNRKLLVRDLPPDSLPPIVTYQDVIADIAERFGRPTSSDVFRAQNSYGAQLEYPFSEWNLPELLIQVQATDLSLTAPITEVIVVTQAEAAAESTGSTAKRRDSLQ